MPDVWHPVSEEPPEQGWYLVRGTLGIKPWNRPAYAELHFGGELYWRECRDHGLVNGVTHWAHITYPPAPEVE